MHLESAGKEKEAFSGKEIAALEVQASLEAVGEGRRVMAATLLAEVDAVTCREVNFLSTSCRP